MTDILVERDGLQRVQVDLDGPEPERAYVLTALVPPVQVGDRVVVNTTAVDLGLGTGGWHVVHWNLEKKEWSAPGPGHILKLRYTSLQVDTGAVGEDHPDLPTRIDDIPVVVCSVHSQVPCVVVAALDRAPGLRISYVMTDGAALPLALSDLVADMVGGGLLVGTVTAGHAFGGDAEAVSAASALATARHLFEADLVIVGMGPGVVGTDTPLGTTALEAPAWLEATATLGGRAVLAARVSSGDSRGRHRGLSHHTETILAHTSTPVTVADDPHLGPLDGHEVVAAPAVDVAGLLADRGLRVTTMGRPPEEDQAFFAAAGAAGWVAAGMVP